MMSPGAPVVPRLDAAFLDVSPTELEQHLRQIGQSTASLLSAISYVTTYPASLDLHWPPQRPTIDLIREGIVVGWEHSHGRGCRILLASILLEMLAIRGFDQTNQEYHGDAAVVLVLESMRSPDRVLGRSIQYLSWLIDRTESRTLVPLYRVCRLALLGDAFDREARALGSQLAAVASLDWRDCNEATAVFATPLRAHTRACNRDWESLMNDLMLRLGRASVNLGEVVGTYKRASDAPGETQGE